ncbi:MAG: asparagine synthase (glutamine-hydrolyzing) [Nanoarchaeota archaeon]|nr:asparagine synthase (glutamine-hydrolyzing) [Nanoarchaeota archaeon]
MCGIVGFNWDERPLLKDMCFSLEHRGPDDFGYYVDKGISIGHRRLSIIDLSKAGNQPLCNENKTLWIVYNGEIYNFKKIRTHLETAGHNFISNTDTEVVLHAYEEYGTDCLNLFNGMFAFAIYDSEKKKLFLARDRIGIKPLYFFLKEGKFAFASELKALFVKGVLKKEFNMGPLSSFLTFRANTTEQSFFKNVNKLKSGHYLTFDLKTRELQIEKYWDFSYKPEYKKERYFSQKLLELLEDSVKSRLMSDVPYGAYLSGGVDSGTIVSLMSQFCSNPVNTFSVGFEEEDHCETKEARFLSENLNTNHHELLIGQSSIKHLPEILYHADEPMADPTSIPIYLLSEYAKKKMHCYSNWRRLR